jgi:hypothetical protein
MLAVPLPEEFRGKTVDVLTDDEEKLLRIVQADYNFRHPKSLKQILKEQNAKPLQFDDSIPEEPAWASTEEFCTFLEAIGEDPNHYQ